MRWSGSTTVVAMAVLGSTGCQVGGGDEPGLVVFAASSLTEAAEELLSEQQASGGDRADLVLGGSAALAAQIRDGAPADIFLSADRRWADRVADLCSPRCSVHPFATNSLVLAVPAGNPAEVSGLDDLSRSELTVVLCAREVPCGVLGELVTTENGVVPDVDSFESSVRAVRTLLELDEADVGLIYATDVNDAVDVVSDARLDEHRNTYSYVVLDPNDPGSRFLTDFISGPSGQSVLADLGFGAVTS